MTLQGMILTNLGCLLFCLGILRLLQKNRLFLEFAVLWFCVAGSIMVVVTVPGLLALLNRFKDIFFASPLYVIASLLFVLVFLVYITVSLSHLRRQVVQMAREVARMTGTER